MVRATAMSPAMAVVMATATRLIDPRLAVMGSVTDMETDTAIDVITTITIGIMTTEKRQS